MIDVALLGTGGMMPLPDRFLSSMVCRLKGRLLLIDCGEGTQVSHKMLGWGYKNIDVICLTHLHGDHITGLPGMLLTIGNSGRNEKITIIGPPNTKQYVQSLLVVAHDLPFEIEYIEVYEQTTIKVNEYEISTFVMEHRIECLAYEIYVRRVGKFSKEKALLNKVPMEYWGKLQKGEIIEDETKTYTKDMVLGSERKGIKIFYMTDSRPVENVESFVKDADLLISEGLYADDTKIDKAKSYMHMTFTESSNIAKNGNVKELWLTHFSPSLTKPEEHLSVATDIFENTKVGYDRISKTIYFE